MNYGVCGNRVKLCIAEIQVTGLLDILKSVIVHEATWYLKIAEVMNFLAFENTPNSVEQQRAEMEPTEIHAPFVPSDCERNLVAEALKKRIKPQ